MYGGPFDGQEVFTDAPAIQFAHQVRYDRVAGALPAATAARGVEYLTYRSTPMSTVAPPSCRVYVLDGLPWPEETGGDLAGS